MFVCNSVAQTQLIRATAAIDSAVFATMQWLASVKPSSGCLYTLAEELKSQVKKMGGFFQLLIQVDATKGGPQHVRGLAPTQMLLLHLHGLSFWYDLRPNFSNLYCVGVVFLPVECGLTGGG